MAKLRVDQSGSANAPVPRRGNLKNAIRHEAQGHRAIHVPAIRRLRECSEPLRDAACLARIMP